MARRATSTHTTAANEPTPRSARRRVIKGLDADQRLHQRREKLLDAALERFAVDGYANAAIEQICQDAGVSTRSYYELFDGKESCYLALLRQQTERLTEIVVETLRDAPTDEHEATHAVMATFVHALVDDSRIVRVTFGQGGAVSPAVDRQRRANRRWAAGFVESIWAQYGVTPIYRRPGRTQPDVHRMAIGLIGGMFDLIADCMHDTELTEGADLDVGALITELEDFYYVVRAGVTGSS